MTSFRPDATLPNIEEAIEHFGKAHRFRTYVGRLENGAASPMLVDLQDLAEALGDDIPRLPQPS